MYICIRMCIFTYIYRYIYMYIYLFIYIYMQKEIYSQINIYTSRTGHQPTIRKPLLLRSSTLISLSTFLTPRCTIYTRPAARALHVCTYHTYSFVYHFYIHLFLSLFRLIYIFIYIYIYTWAPPTKNSTKAGTQKAQSSEKYCAHALIPTRATHHTAGCEASFGPLWAESVSCAR